MNVFTRGVRNAFRNSIRTFSIVAILGLSVGLALSMLVARQAVQNKIEAVKSSIGNSITIAPAGVQGFQGGGEPLTEEQLSSVKSIDHVAVMTETLNDRLTSETSNLESAIEAGSLGRRQAGNSGVVLTGPGPSNDSSSESSSTSSQPTMQTFTPPIIVTGVSSLDDTSVYGGSDVTYTSGKAFDAASDANVAVIGKSLAEKNNLSVGSKFTAYGTEVEVVGIYDSGNTFSNGNLLMPLATLQRLSEQENAITSATVTVDSVDNIDSVVSAIESELGDAADVTNNQESAKQAIAPLENVKSISLFSLIGALVAGAVIILLSMTMIVRERRREIGVMKAIGSTNLKTMLQFMSEAVTLTVLGLVAGLIIGVASASPITNTLVNNSTNSSQAEGPTASGEAGGGPRLRLMGGGNLGGLANVREVQASVGWDMIGYGVGAALIIAIVGSAAPAYLISKIRPSEVMRVE